MALSSPSFPPLRRAQKTGSPSKCGRQLQTMLARASSNAPKLQLPMTARSRLLISFLGDRAPPRGRPARSEEHTSELKSLMRNSYAVFCLKQKQAQKNRTNKYTQ